MRLFFLMSDSLNLIFKKLRLNGLFGYLINFDQEKKMKGV